MKAWGRTLTRSSLLLLAAVVLGGCVALDGSVGGMVPECAKVNEKALKYINWTKVPEVDVRIRHDEFQPMILRLRQGWPYVIRIRNRDERAHVFQAYEFFRNVAVIQTSIAGNTDHGTCFASISIPPHETAELRLIASVDGYYEIEDAPRLLPNLISFGPSGIIIVEERRPRI